MMRHASHFMILIVLLSACSTTQAPSNIAVEDAWLRPVSMAGMGGSTDAMASETSMPMEGMDHGGDMEPAAGISAAYATLVNSGGADVLQSVATDAAVAEIHQTTMTDNIMRMEPVASIDIPANGSVEFSPGGYHIMLNDVSRPLAPGDTITLTFTFERAGAQQVSATVREP